MILLDSFHELWWMASFSFSVCSLLESVLQRGVGRQTGGACLFALSWLWPAGWGISPHLAGSKQCWAWGALRCGVAGRDAAPGEPVASRGPRDCWGEQGANSLVLRMLKRKAFRKDLEGTAKSLLRFKHPEDASALRARLEKRMCLQGYGGTGEVWFTNPFNFLYSRKSVVTRLDKEIYFVMI